MYIGLLSKQEFLQKVSLTQEHMGSFRVHADELQEVDYCEGQRILFLLFFGILTNTRDVSVEDIKATVNSLSAVLLPEDSDRVGLRVAHILASDDFG